jgi:hypothetical protein
MAYTMEQYISDIKTKCPNIHFADIPEDLQELAVKCKTLKQMSRKLYLGYIFMDGLYVEVPTGITITQDRFRYAINIHTKIPVKRVNRIKCDSLAEMYTKLDLAIQEVAQFGGGYTLKSKSHRGIKRVRGSGYIKELEMDTPLEVATIYYQDDKRLRLQSTYRGRVFTRELGSVTALSKRKVNAAIKSLLSEYDAYVYKWNNTHVRQAVISQPQATC